MRAGGKFTNDLKVWECPSGVAGGFLFEIKGKMGGIWWFQRERIKRDSNLLVRVPFYDRI